MTETSAEGGNSHHSRSQIEFLRKCIKDNKQNFYRSRKVNRQIAFFLKISVVTLGALATVLLGVKTYVAPPWENFLSATALVITASIPILSAWESFYDPRWLWIRYSNTLGQIYTLSDELEFASAASGGQALPQEILDEMFKRLQEILSNTNTDWFSKRSRDRDDQSKGAGG